METGGLMGKLYWVSEWIMRISVINLLWFILSLPVMYIAGVEIYLWKIKMDSLFTFFLLLSGLMPFTLFPATSAMFTVTRKWVMGDTDVPLFSTFFHGYKENYVKSMFGGLLLAVFLILMIVNVMFYRNLHGNLQYISVFFAAASIIVLASAMNYFHILVHFHMKFWQAVKNCVLITVTFPIQTLSMILFNLFILYVSTFHFVFLYFFFTGSIMSFFNFWQFHRIYIKISDKNKENGDVEDGTGA